MGKKKRQQKGQAPAGSKTCAVCGRPFENRKSWESRGVWDEVKYCSTRCRNDARRQRRQAGNAS